HPPEAWVAARRAARRLISPVERFVAIEAASGILLLVAALIAIVWANSPWRDSYDLVWRTPLGLRLGEFTFTRDLRFWVNDGLMAIFFFVVGLEIRREIHAGELSTLRRAALPLFAALGGMIAPALIYLAFNGGTPAARGWGVPMATDIAFAVGVLALLGKRVPPAVRILLLALAVIDDLGAILVIAFFYTSGIQLPGVAMSLTGILLILGLQKLGARGFLSYTLPALIVWAGAYAAGVHPTLAGVVIGLLTPVRVWAGRETASPAERLESALHGWVAFVIMPTFALANAGFPVAAVQLGGGAQSVLFGVVLGLVLGKPIGIFAICWITVRLRLAALPTGARWREILLVGIVAGIGFTMSLFIASLAFPPGPLAEIAKLGILLASVIAGVAGGLAGWLLLPRATKTGPAR
ncbi:MAG TPA: Na+/H+ antiporter NhaA, partial [Polyangia bacterium]